VTTPEFIVEIHQLILKDRRISVKWMAEKLGSQVRGLGRSFMKIWTYGISAQIGSRNVWTRIKNINDASRLSNCGFFFFCPYPNHFWQRLVTMDETWLYHYEPETKKQSMGWPLCVSKCPASKKYECKNSLEELWPRYFGIQTAYFSLIILQRAKYQGGVLLTSAGAI
jgi:hypothetical protein